MKKDKTINLNFNNRRSIKDLIESCGIPHVEIGFIKINNNFVLFNEIVKDKDDIEVFPFTSVEPPASAISVHPGLPEKIRFVLDVHLHKLARKLRMLGFDTDYANDRNDNELAAISESQNKILLTRDRQLLMHKNVKYGLYIRNIFVDKQIREVVNAYNLFNKFNPLSRCVNCNGIIEKLPSETNEFKVYKEQIPEKVLCWCKEYTICRNCRQIYWKGSKYQKLISFINSLKS